MNTKRWIAIIVAALLLMVSIGVSTLSFIFTRDFAGLVDELIEQSDDYREEVIEQGVAKEKIAVLTLDGVIQDTGNASPLFASPGYNHRFFMNQLNEIYEDRTIKGVVLSVNTPGGGVVESAEIYDAIKAIQAEREIPVYVSMGAMAASGGYYVAAPADKIFVNQETLTGSIGVIMESINYAKLAENYGIEFNTIKTGPYKDIMSGSREMTDEEREMLQEMINDSYERFVDIIVEGRNLPEKEVKKVADGRILNGRQAIEAGLADEYGKLAETVEALKTDYGLENPTVFEYKISDSISSLFGVKMHALLGGTSEQEIITSILSNYNSPRMMYLYGEY